MRPNGGREPLDLNARRAAFTAGHTARDLEAALYHLLQQVGPDLGAEDYSDDAFLDYAGDAMSDARVPPKMIDAALEWCRDGGRGRIPDTREAR